MIPSRAPGQSRRSQARETLERQDDFGVVLILILLTIVVAAAAIGPVGQVISVALSGGTLLYVLHTAGAHRRIFRTSTIIVVVAVITAAVSLFLGETVGNATTGLVGRVAGRRRADRDPAPDRAEPGDHGPAGPGRAGHLSAPRPGVLLSVPPHRDADQGSSSSSRPRTPTPRTTSISATRRWRPSATATTRPHRASAGWFRCRRRSSGSSTWCPRSHFWSATWAGRCAATRHRPSPGIAPVDGDEPASSRDA